MKSFVMYNLMDVDKFITLDDAMSSGIIPEDYHEFFSDRKKCACGSDLITNKSLTTLKCSNPNCIYKLASRLANVYQMFFTGVGVESCRGYIGGYQLKSLIDAYEKCGEEYRKATDDWLSLPHYIGDIILYLSVPYVGNTAKDIFPDLESFNYVKDHLLHYGWTEFYSLHKLHMDDENVINKLNNVLMSYPELFGTFKSKLEAQGLTVEPDTAEDFINALRTLGMSRYVRTRIGGSKNAAKIAISLIDHFDELVYFIGKANIRTTAAEVKCIVITGDVLRATYPDGTAFSSKQEYIDYINNIIADCGVCYKLSTALVSTDFVIADTDTPTRKYQAGKQMNKLITSDEFLARIIETRKKYLELIEIEKRKLNE